AATHLRGRSLHANPTNPLFVRQNGITVANQLGTFSVDVIKREQLLTPANKSLAPPAPPEPDPQTHNVDRFQCYKVKPKTRFAPVALTVSDQFRTTNDTFTVIKPKRLCVAVDENGKGRKEPTHNL